MILAVPALALGFAGCAPATDDQAAAPPAEEVETDDSLGLPPHILGDDSEGSEPKREGGDASDAAAGDAMAKEEGVDTSIRDAAEFGDDALLEGLVPEGWSQTADIEHYNVATLYNKINGRSELYMAYDVRGLSWITMVDDANKDNFLDVFIYDMQNPTGAFGIYSVEREQGQEKIDIGREAYKTGSNFYFWKGKYYGYINASQTDDSNTKAGLAVATALLERIEDDGSPVHGLDWLPREGLVEDSIQYFKADAMSLDFMTETFLGEYDFGGEERVKAFITKRADAADAQQIFASFNKYGEEYGSGTSAGEVAGVPAGFTDWGGDFYDAVAAVDNSVIGVTNVEGKDNAVAAMEKLVGSLK